MRRIGLEAVKNKTGIHAFSKEQRSALRKGAPHTEESRRKMSVSQTGRKHPQSVKDKIAKAHSVRVTCSECGMISSPAGIGQHQKCSGHVGEIK